MLLIPHLRRMFYIPAMRMLSLLLLIPLLLAARTTDTLSVRSTISMLTIHPGEALYSAFGHSAFRVQDPAQELDRIYNYGTFSFEEPGFYMKFTRGLLDYQLSAYPFTYAVEEYTIDQRACISQQLDLTHGQRMAMFRFLETNYLPENRRYRYDFFLDNCATRIRDVFEESLGDSVELFYNQDRQLTFRQYIDLYTDSFRFSDYGMGLGLGNKADRLATPREALFLPDFLYESVERARIFREGEWQPLVSSTDTLLWFDHSGTPPWSPPWPQLIYWTLFTWLAAVTIRQYRDGQDSPAWMRRVDGSVYLLVGIAGCLILFLWFGTNHKVTPSNWDILWAWPTHLIAGILRFRRSRPRWLRRYFLLNSAMMAITLAGWPFWPQDLHPANIPLVLILGIRSLHNSRDSVASVGPPQP